MPISNWIAMIRTDAKNWSAGKLWQPRALILLFFAWIFAHHILSWVGIVDHPYMNFFIGRANFLVHELGHFVFIPFGEFIQIAGGSIFQLLVPVILMAGFYKQRDYFAIAFAFCWLGTNFFYVATYIADARAQELALLSPSGATEPIHDWNYLLGRLDWLGADQFLAALVRLTGIATMAAGFCFGAWLLLNMARRISPKSSLSANQARNYSSTPDKKSLFD